MTSHIFSRTGPQRYAGGYGSVRRMVEGWEALLGEQHLGLTDSKEAAVSTVNSERRRRYLAATPERVHHVESDGRVDGEERLIVTLTSGTVLDLRLSPAALHALAALHPNPRPGAVGP